MLPTSNLKLNIVVIIKCWIKNTSAYHLSNTTDWNRAIRRELPFNLVNCLLEKKEKWDTFFCCLGLEEVAKLKILFINQNINHLFAHKIIYHLAYDVCTRFPPKILNPKT